MVKSFMFYAGKAGEGVKVIRPGVDRDEIQAASL
jgi:hypothetical protein